MIALTVVVYALGVLSCVHAIMTARTEQGAIAWAVALIAFPWVAVPAYWVLGRSRFHGYVVARRGNMEEVAGVTKQAAAQAAPFEVPEAEIHPAARAAQHLAGIPALRGNTVDLLVDGDATFQSIFQGIDAAREYVLVEFYIVHDDAIGRDLKAHLVERARAGVRVRFLYDEIGSHDLPRAYLDELRAAGIEVHEFHTQKGPRNRFQLNFRNHRKIVVVDGRIAWVGGHNVGDEYLSRNPKIGPWRDTHVRIEGPAALGAQLAFADDWHWAAGGRLDVRWDPVPSKGGNVPVLVVPSSPADTLETANLMYIHAINSARERIWIASPYFVPDKPVTDALQLAGLRGVDVRILIPDKPDNPLVGLAAYSYLDDASLTGAKFYRYGAGFLHEKVMLIDHGFASVGTANFDNRSFRLNFEITALISDAAFAADVERMFEADFARSRVMDPGEYDRKPWWFRFGARLARLTGPIQ
ncbi:MAG TPA: cardiolipin synthase [Thermoanaerobaculia bacterium]|nr:cardiolipin synthase [Thermoanaerobaculia bacterium]